MWPALTAATSALIAVELKAAQTAEATETAKQDIVEIAAGADDFSTLAAAVKAADLI